MDEICATIKSFLELYGLNHPEHLYLVAFSGGYDSMCLLDALRRTAPKNKIAALHLNHKWRGEESDGEEENCREFCNKNGIVFYCENLPPDVPQTETAAREARYKFFERCANKFKSSIIFTAHNANDNAETMIYRICKGTGVTGLCGILPHRDIYYRPLLTVSREKIENYCIKHSLKPNNDSSNLNTKYKRNFIRAKILPEFLKINPDAIEKFNSLSDVAKEECEIITEYLTMVLNKISCNGRINTQKFFNLSNALQKRIIYKIFTDYNLDCDKTKILRILNFLKENSVSKSGKTCSLTDGLLLFINDKYFEVIHSTPDAKTYFHILHEGKYEDENCIFEIEKFDKDVKKFPKDCENTAYVDLSGFEMDFELRTRQDGDSIKPFGLNGSQKLKKYLNARKIPNHVKNTMLFLVRDKEVLWAINSGISDKIKVKTRPTHKLKFYRKEHNNDKNNG